MHRSAGGITRRKFSGERECHLLKVFEAVLIDSEGVSYPTGMFLPTPCDYDARIVQAAELHQLMVLSVQHLPQGH